MCDDLLCVFTGNKLFFYFIMIQFCLKYAMFQVEQGEVSVSLDKVISDETR